LYVNSGKQMLYQIGRQLKTIIFLTIRGIHAILKNVSYFTELISMPNREDVTMKLISELIGNRKPYSVTPHMTVQDTVEYLCARRIGAVAVCDHRKVVGVFSERDLLRRVVLPGLDPKKTSVKEVMTTGVVHVKMGDRHSAARNLMLGKNFRHLVVLDDNDYFAGFVSIRELIEVELKESQELVHKLNDDYYEEQFKPDH